MHRSRVIAKTYDYLDERGELLFQVVRYDPKDFAQRRPDGRGGYIWRLDAVRRVLYRLPAVLAAAAGQGVVYIVEGERDVHSAEQAGVVATCNAGGACKWLPEYTESLRGCSLVVIVADRDLAGSDNARQIADALDGIVEYRVVQPATGNDLSDHLDAGFGIDDLRPFAPVRSSWGAPPAPANRERGGAPARRGCQDDPLLRISPHTYVTLLTGIEPNARAKISCPFHEDRTPSFHAYATPERGWYCFSCNRGGSIYDLCRALWNDDSSFSELRRRIAAALREGTRG